MDNEFSIRIEDSPESSGSLLQQRMIVNVPEATENVQFTLIGDAVINTGALWQYGVTYDGRVFRFHFNCTPEIATGERNLGFLITNTSVIEIGDPNGTPFLVCSINVLCAHIHVSIIKPILVAKIIGSATYFLPKITKNLITICHYAPHIS